VLGAEGVQVGSRFVCSVEASSHINFKEAVVKAGEGATILSMKSIIPVRLMMNRFYQQIKTAEEQGASKEELQQILGKGRAKKGMFEGELDEGELEIGQVSALVNNIIPAAEIVNEIWQDFNAALEHPLM
jgi:enoyl-[acyl-carrier protein] reductase II